MNTILRRRTMMASGGEDPWADWVKLRVKNTSSSKQINIYNLNKIERMVIDGVEVAPVNNYDFGETTNYHDVYILPKDFSTGLGDTDLWHNSIVRYADFPAKLSVFGSQNIRNLGASQRVDTAVRSEIMPTFGLYNWHGWTLGRLYVPASLYDDYVAAGYLAASKIYTLDEYPYTWTIY